MAHAHRASPPATSDGRTGYPRDTSDLAILGPVMPIVAGVVIRAGVFAPDTVERLRGEVEDDGS